MKYLLDVNVLVALGLSEHEFHERVVAWISDLTAKAIPEFATCSITELSFARILTQAPQYGLTVAQARALLVRIKAATKQKFTFIPDDQDISQLPDWVRTPKQITDGHLAQLARANGGVLATLDRKIPGAFVIPPEK
jgi:hypothetical protein